MRTLRIWNTALSLRSLENLEYRTFPQSCENLEYRTFPQSCENPDPKSAKLASPGAVSSPYRFCYHFWKNSFTHRTFGVVTFVLGGVGTRDPVRSKELDSAPTHVRKLFTLAKYPNPRSWRLRERCRLPTGFATTSGTGCRTRLASGVVARVPGGVGARDPVHSKELGVCSNCSPTFSARKEKPNLSQC